LEILGLNILAVIGATVFTMALGAVWYGPLLFERAWVESNRHTREHLASLKSRLPVIYAICALSYLLTAFVLGQIVQFANARSPQAGAAIGLFCWTGFALPLALIAGFFAGRSARAMALDLGYQLIFFLVMGAILAMWG
jgi:hypothetical protein